jgi:hypothetical protein
MKHARKTHRRRTHHKRSTRRIHRRRGGADALSGAPVNYHLSGDWSSRMSLGQGADYFKYHEGQHGGALGMGAYPEAVLSPGLPQALRGPAHLDGIDKAINDVKGLCDPPNCPGTQGPVTTGGKRRRRSTRQKSRSKSKRHTKKHGRKHRRTHRRRSTRRRGGALGYAPFPSSGMLLSSPKAYAEAGLNPEWKTDVAFTDAKIRESQ